jgi:RNA polymerase sigma-70 factor (ECF subfamily)
LAKSPLGVIRSIIDRPMTTEGESEMTTTAVRPSSRRMPEWSERFEREVLTHLDRLYAGARWMTSDGAAAEDLVQRAVERALRDFHPARPESAVRVWLFGHLVGAWFDAEPLHPGAPGRVRPTVPATADEVILGAKDALTPIVRITLYLVDVEEFDYREVAAVTEVTPGIVESRVRRAHERLSDRLAAWLRDAATGGE